MSDSRAEFEALALSDGASIKKTTSCTSGEKIYASPYTRGAWWAWQASRAQPERKLTDAAAILAALEIGLECANEVASVTHANLKGYMPHKHAAVDADVQKIEAAIALLAAQPAAVTVPEWQPIETAPKGVNGYSFMQLAWGPEEDKCIGDGMRYGDKFFAASVFHCIGKDRRYAFREHEVKPTHWMPLPQPPAAQAQDDGEKR